MLSRLRYFLSAAELKSLTRAAAVHGISQSAISQHLDALEKELGFRLFVSPRRSLRLTDAGESFYSTVRQLVSAFDRKLSELKRQSLYPRSCITLGVLSSFMGPELTAALNLLRAGEIDFTLRRATHEELFDDMRLGKVDLILNDQRRSFSPVYVNRVAAVRPRYVTLSPAHPLASHDRLTLESLRSYPCLMLPPPAFLNPENRFYRKVIGIEGELHACDSLSTALLQLEDGKSLFLGDGHSSSHTLLQKPLLAATGPLNVTYCVFYVKEGARPLQEEAADLICKAFQNH